MGFISLIMMVVNLAASWRVFQKMGRQGWEGIVPLYNVYVWFELLYGKGSKMFMILIPFYGIYVMIKFYIDLAHAFNETTGFGWGLVFLGPIFMCILAFGDAEYLDGSRAVVGNDAVSNVLNNIAGAANAPSNAPSAAQPAASRNESGENALEILKELAKLHQEGILTDEEFNQKKSELLGRV